MYLIQLSLLGYLNQVVEFKFRIYELQTDMLSRYNKLLKTTWRKAVELVSLHPKWFVRWK